LAHQNFDDVMEDIFVNLSKYLKKNNLKAIIAIDEFQQIATIKEKNIEATLRTYIQNIDNISFVFSGSKKHLLTQMFTDYAKPFYAQAIPLELKPIACESFYAFVKEKFLQTNKTFQKEAFEQLYNRVDGESWLIQNCAYHLWQRYDVVELNYIEETIKDIANMSDAIYKLLFDNFTNTQKSALKMIVRHNGINLLSKELLSMNNISKSSLVSALNTLIDKEIIDKTDGAYFINDKLFEIWLEEK
jgi:AAA+ ATPase superfamily predicted ATPase